MTPHCRVCMLSETGEFIHETQLYGMLDWLRDFGVELVSVNAIEENGAA